jgi:hypothetical protein
MPCGLLLLGQASLVGDTALAAAGLQE